MGVTITDRQVFAIFMVVIILSFVIPHSDQRQPQNDSPRKNLVHSRWNISSVPICFKEMRIRSGFPKKLRLYTVELHSLVISFNGECVT